MGKGLFRIRRQLATDNLKRCPLCGAVNARQNAECFVCRWQGEFSHEPADIEDGLEDLVERCPELAELMVRSCAGRPSLSDRMARLLFRVMPRGRYPRSLDFWV